VVVVGNKEKDIRFPLQLSWIYQYPLFRRLFPMLFEYSIRQVDYMLTFIIFDHLKCLTPVPLVQLEVVCGNDIRVHDIPVCDGCLLSHLVQTNLILALEKQFHNLFLPIRSIPQ
jgi:hypothetical protein